MLCEAAEHAQRLKAELDGTPERSWWLSELVHRRPLPKHQLQPTPPP